MNASLHILQQYWKYPAFRGEQEKIIDAVLQQKDVLALLPTGGGKSVCFQVPTMLMNGLCLVISPLIALMKDQVENLEKKNIKATALYSGMSFNEVKNTLQNAAEGKYKFLYLSPERLETELFKIFLHELPICLIAVDEAHCISQWGYDFRPPYLRIVQLRKELPHVPIIALTASATTLVQKDIIDKLQLQQPSVFLQSFEKPNLSFSVFKVDSKINKTIEVLNNVKGSAIVYCKNRNETQKIAQLLQQKNIVAAFYHAGLTQEQRSKIQTNWIQNKSRVIVCTNAFGMGIDKPDVRTVVHYSTTDCLENYYQESGRAGRDSKKAYAVLLYNTTDEIELKNLPAIKFPKIDEIKNVYQSIANYLQIPIGSGEGIYYDFNLLEFCNNFKLDVFLVINALRFLEKEGHLAFNQNIFIPSKIMFSTDKNILNNIENSHPALDKVMKTLLRTYEGIYEYKVSVNEKLIAKYAQLPYEKVYNDLAALNKLGIIEYTPQKETPQLYFILNRASAHELNIDYNTYVERKNLYKQRVEKMIDYLHLQNECRSKFLAAYFGDNHVKDCGICDNCLRNKKRILSETEFKNIEQLIYRNIHQQVITAADLIQQLKPIKKEKIIETISFLQKENKIKIDATGAIQKV